MFDDFDFTDFWIDSEYALNTYDSGPFTDKDIEDIENKLGYKLPPAYIYLMKTRNGGMPSKCCCPCEVRTGWAADHVEITGIYGIGHEKMCALDGGFGSRFWIEGWEYPDIGIAICDCPSAGHDMVFLDYRECGPEGEPKVVHIDNELDNQITPLADSFEEFITKLRPESDYYVEDDTPKPKMPKLSFWKKLTHKRYGNNK